MRTDGAIDADARLEILHLEQVIGSFVSEEEREELETYLEKEKEAGRFSFETILKEELKLDQDSQLEETTEDGDKETE